MSINVIKENAKALITLIGLCTTALLVNGLSGSWETELTIVSVLATTITTWAVPNKPKAESARTAPYLEDERGEFSLTGLVAAFVVFLLILGLASMLGLI